MQPPAVNEPRAPSTVAVSLRGFSKTFGAKRVLDDVSLDIAPGSIHALLGGNGSGKSTLVKALSGVQPADPGGSLTVGPATVESHHVTPAWVRRCGLRFVHQNPGVFPTMTVAENLFISHSLLSTSGWLSRRRLERASRRLLSEFHLDFDPRGAMGDLGPADQTMVAIARALRTDPRDKRGISALVLDEPTAALPEEEVEILLNAIKRIARVGASIVYITHRLQEVLLIADTVTVLRNGRQVATEGVGGLTEPDLVSRIVGRPLDEFFPHPAPTQTDRHVVLSLRNVCGSPLNDVSLNVSSGEIVGIAGLLGSGRSELLRSVFGHHPVTSGEILVNGKPSPLNSPSTAMSAGIAYVPESREIESVFPDLSVATNLTSANILRHTRLGFTRRAAERADVLRAIADYGVRAPSITAPMSTLSGGNQQKVVLARWMRRDPAILLLDEPTQGVDVGARADVYRLVRSAVDQRGLAVLLVSSDFEELSELSDRVLILNEGSIAGEVHGADLDPHRLTELVLLAHTTSPYKEPVS